MLRNPKHFLLFRLILQEEVVTLAAERELFITDKEINSFQKQLELSRQNLSDHIEGCELNEHERKRLNKSKSTFVTDAENVVSTSCDVSNSELFSNLKINTTGYEIRHNPDSLHNRGTNTLTNTDVTTNDGTVKGNTENSKKLQCNEGYVYNRQDLMCSVWKRWKLFIINKKLSMAKDHTTEINTDVCKKIQTQINKKIMRKYWDTWLHMVRQKRRALSEDHCKLQREEKINKFLKVLQQQKQSLITIKTPAMMKNVNNVMTGTSRNSKYSYHNYQHCNKTYNKQNVQENAGFQIKTCPSHQNYDYQHRFEVQQKIIAEQKCKLEEQSKLIKELQLAHFRLQTEKSAKEAQEEINQTLSSCDLRLKPKAKQVKTRLSTECRGMQLSKNKVVVVSLKTDPTILKRMEERAQEREKMWKLIKERKQKLIEEKENKKRQEEEEKEQKEAYEKWQKIEELKEKRRLEKHIEIQKKRDREKMHNLMIRASLQYKKMLMKKVILSLKQLMVHKRELMKIAEKHHKSQLLCNYFQTWKTQIQSIIYLKIYKATALYNRVLVKKVFRGLFQVTNINHIQS